MTTSRHILLIDDDPIFLGMASAALKAARYRVTCANDGEKAAALVELERFDLVVLDCGLMGRSELQLLNAFQRLSGVKRRVVISGRVTPFYRRVLEIYGADAVAAKPIALAELVQLVAAAFVEDDEQGSGVSSSHACTS